MKLKLQTWQWPLLFVVVTAITLWRSSGYVLTPVLRAEDGSKVFTFFYEHRSPRFLFHFKAGYIPLLPNILGWLSVRLPPRVTPYFLTVMPTLLSAFTTSVFGLAAYRRYVESDVLRFAVCLALAIAPVGPMMTVSNTDYSIWSALLLLLWLVLLPMPRQPALALAFTCVLALLIWTHPLSIVALPASLLWVWRERSHFARALQGVLVLCSGAHLFFGTHTEHAAFTKKGGPIQRLGELVSGVVDHVCHQVIAPTILPVRPESAWLVYTISALFMLGLVACAFVPWERLASAPFCAWVGYGIAVPMALVVFARDESGLNASRYHFVSRAFAEVGCCLLVAQIIALGARWVPKISRGALGPALGAFGALAYVGFCGIVSGRSAHFEEPDARNAQLVHTFFSQLADAEKERGGYCNIRLRCNKRSGDWPFGVDTRKDCDQ